MLQCEMSRNIRRCSTKCESKEERSLIGRRLLTQQNLIAEYRQIIFTDHLSHFRLLASFSYLSGTLPRFPYSHIMSTHRKSVAFSDEHTVVASNGEVIEVNGTGTPDKSSAESHSIGEFVSGPHTATAY